MGDETGPVQGSLTDLEWTDEELAELLKPAAPKTGAEIAAMIESGEPAHYRCGRMVEVVA